MNINVKANPGFRAVNQSHARYIVMKGSAGSGKSVDTAQNYILRLMQDNGRNLVAMRKSDITNRDSTFAELTGAIYRMFGDNAERYWKINKSPLKLTCRHNGNQIIFRGMNDDKQREKLKSITFQRGKLTDVWLEEATEFTQADVEIIDDRLRGELPPGQFYQIRMTLNPVNKNHWIKKVFFDLPDPNVLTHHSTYLGNRFIDDAYRARMERRKLVDPEGYIIYGLGEWGEIGGLILRNWEIKDVSRNINDFDDVALGQDFGFNHANAVLMLGIKDDDIYILDEIYLHEKDTGEIIQEAIKHALPAKKTMWCDSAEPDRIKEWNKAGFRARPVDKGGSKGSVNAQIDWLKQRRIYVHPHVRHAYEREVGESMNERINGLTREEIKRVMVVCLAANFIPSYSTCKECPSLGVVGCKFHMANDALALIEQLERERAAAIADMKQAAFCLCDVCKKYHTATREHPHYCGEIGIRPDWNCPIICGSFEWRGPQEETTPEAKP